jgi:thymidylate synthase
MNKNKWEEYGKWRHGKLRNKYINMNNLDTRYQALLQDILDNGVEKKDRTGTGTLSVFGRQIHHKMSEGFPLLTTKKMAWNVMVAELMWFLRGDTNIKFLLDYDCHIWTGDAYKRYVEAHKKEWSDKMTLEQLEKSYPDVKEFENLIKTVPEFAKKWGELGPIYGKQWREWETDDTDAPRYEHHKKDIDQIQNLINELKTNPDSRRLMVSAWNVGQLDEMVLPPCHYGFQVYTRELSSQERMDVYNKSDWNKDIFPSDVSGWNRLLDTYNIPKRAISLMWNQRSVDTFLGLPFNIASYGLLLEIIAKEVNMIPDELIGNLGDVHLYSNHIEQAKEQIYRTAYELPKLGMDYREGEYDKNLTNFVPDDFYLIDYQSHPSIKAPLSN